MNLKRSTSTIEAAEKKEKRVLIQMSVLVVAFLLFWLPFWVYLMTMHICLVVYDEVRTIVEHMKTLEYQQARLNIRGRLDFVHTNFLVL